MGTPLSRCCSHDDALDEPQQNVETRRRKHSEKFGPKSLLRKSVDGPRAVVVIVDPISTGAALADEFYWDCDLVRVDVCLSESLRDHVNPFYAHIKYYAQVEFDNEETDFDTACSKCAMDVKLMCNDRNPVACIAGAECGVEVAELLAEYLGIKTNDASMSMVRRDKYFMGEQVRKAGVRAVKQKRCKLWEEVTQFVEESKFDPFEYIIKPINSAGSDNVRLCKNLRELRLGFEAIVGKKNVLGIIETSCLVQECLHGDEYVVDTVTRKGVHKTCAIWMYDKRPCNGEQFIYFGMRMVDGNTKTGKRLSQYIHSVLDALGVQNSAGHSEVKLKAGGQPCLIECGARPHGGDGNWIAMALHCVGYSQVSMIRLSWLDFEAFKAVPDVPSMKNYCCEFMLVNRQAGILKSIPRWTEFLGMDTYHSSNAFLQPGMFLPITTNLLTCPGSVILLGSRAKEVEADFEAMRKIELDGLYVFQSKEQAAAERIDLSDYMDSPVFQARVCSISSPRSFRTPKSGAVFGAITSLKQPDVGASKLRLFGTSNAESPSLNKFDPSSPAPRSLARRTSFG